MTPSRHTEERSALIAVCRHLAASGLSPGSSGNVSVRVGDVILMTPTGSALSRVTGDELAVISLAGDEAAPVVAPDSRPSKEFPLHLAVYKARPDARAVVHLHSPFATALSCLPADARGHAPLPPLTPYRVMRLGDVPLAEYAAPGSTALAAGVEGPVRSHDAILLANHGPVLVGRTLHAAADLAEELETAAQLTFLLRGAPATVLPDGEVEALRAAAPRIP